MVAAPGQEVYRHREGRSSRLSGTCQHHKIRTTLGDGCNDDVLPVTFEVEKGCSMLNSCHGYSRCRIAVASNMQGQLSNASSTFWLWELLCGGCAAPCCCTLRRGRCSDGDAMSKTDRPRVAGPLSQTEPHLEGAPATPAQKRRRSQLHGAKRLAPVFGAVCASPAKKRQNFSTVEGQLSAASPFDLHTLHMYLRWISII